MKIVATGYMVRYPLAGMMLAFLHYVLGLQRMGHEVVWVEESGWDDSCYDPGTGLHGSDPTAGIQAVQDMVSRFGFRLPVCYVDRQSGAVSGMSRQQLLAHLSSADLLLNIGGTCALPEFERCRRKVLIDMDPMFTQAGRFAVDDLPEYDAYFTYGTNIGRPGCSIPEAGVRWTATVPPVVTDLWADWADTPPSVGSTMTTVCNWSAYGGIDYEGAHYGQKDEEFMRLLDLPKRSPETLELAISGADEATRSCLTDAGWRLREAEAVTADFDAYAGYIGDSRGEFSVAKNVFVATNNGCFMDRGGHYLATGRPVVQQDT